jgi:predicted nucleotidyltransferase
VRVSLSRSIKIDEKHENPPGLPEGYELRVLGAQRIGVFGSFARGEATVESNVDVDLEFAKGKKNYDNSFAIYELLQGFFGRPIDLVREAV